jgi:hypothetical protein
VAGSIGFVLALVTGCLAIWRIDFFDHQPTKSFRIGANCALCLVLAGILVGLWRALVPRPSPPPSLAVAVKPPSRPIATPTEKIALNAHLLWTMLGDSPEHTTIYLIVGVQNLGEPTTISAWSFRIDAGGRTYYPKMVYIPEDHGIFVSGKRVATIHRRDTVDWAVTTPLEPAHVLQGWLRFRADHTKMEDILQSNAVWQLRFVDIEGKPHIVGKIWTADELAYTFAHRQFTKGHLPPIDGFPAGTDPPFPYDDDKR